MKKYYYVYITTNLVNGKQYVGYHSSNDLEDNYLGSGEALRGSIKKYGKEKFERRILEFINNPNNHLKIEEKWIKEYNTLTPNGYNISPKGGINISGGLSKESIQKMAKSRKGQIPWNKGLKMSAEELEKNRKIWNSEEFKEKTGGSRRGKKHSAISCQKMSKSKKGKSPWNKGIKLSEEQRKKFVESYRKTQGLSPH